MKAEHVVPGITKLIEDLNAELDELEKTVQPTWSSLVEPLERLTDSISRAWSTVSHLKVSLLHENRIFALQGFPQFSLHSLLLGRQIWFACGAIHSCCPPQKCPMPRIQADRRRVFRMARYLDNVDLLRCRSDVLLQYNLHPSESFSPPVEMPVL